MIVNVSQVATFIVWASIEFVHIRFRNALKAQGQSVEDLPFKALWYPYGTYAALAANLFLIFIQGKLTFSSQSCIYANIHRLHCFLEAFRFHGICDELHPSASFCDPSSRVQILEENYIRQAGGDGYLDWKKREPC